MGFRESLAPAGASENFVKYQFAPLKLWLLDNYFLKTSRSICTSNGLLKIRQMCFLQFYSDLSFYTPEIP